MTHNLKRFPEMPSCCCYGLIDGKILRWCGTQRVRFLLWQKQLRAIVRRTMSSLCRRKRLGELCPQAAFVDLYCKIPSFIWHIYNDYNVTETLNLRGQCIGSAETGTLGLLAVHAAGGVVCSTWTEEASCSGTKTHKTPFRCRWKVNVPWRRNSNARFDFLEKASGKWWIYGWYMMISNLFLCLLCFFICLHGGLMLIPIHPTLKWCHLRAFSNMFCPGYERASIGGWELSVVFRTGIAAAQRNRTSAASGVSSFELLTLKANCNDFARSKSFRWKRGEIWPSKLDDFLQNARYIYRYK